jgi:hypothetical protein
VRLGNWLTAEQGQALWQAPDYQRLKGKRDRALLVYRFTKTYPDYPVVKASNFFHR